MQNTDDIERLAVRFFDAIERGDIDTVRACFAAEAGIWHNTDETIVSVDHTLKVLSGLVARIKNVRYENRRLSILPEGFWQRHALTGTRASDGAGVRLPCAIFCEVRDGRITHIDEYFDSAHVAEFR